MPVDLVAVPEFASEPSKKLPCRVSDCSDSGRTWRKLWSLECHSPCGHRFSEPARSIPASMTSSVSSPTITSGSGSSSTVERKWRKSRGYFCAISLSALLSASIDAGTDRRNRGEQRNSRRSCSACHLPWSIAVSRTVLPRLSLGRPMKQSTESSSSSSAADDVFWMTKWRSDISLSEAVAFTHAGLRSSSSPIVLSSWSSEEESEVISHVITLKEGWSCHEQWTPPLP
mmetsp:Transcript_10490/g.22293  ORF Transcript_10490/g.22293 Transcript_10490/m.22293 type:complete len:229 (-) Transcript_10490:352-1038(-)